MKKIFTYLLASAAFCLMGTVNAMADEGTDLTKEMFFNYTNPDAPAAGYCEFVVGKSTVMPYGNGYVAWKEYAELSDYDYLVVTVTARTAENWPRPFINRLEDGQQAAEEYDVHKPIDFNKQWAKDKYMTVSGDETSGWTYTFDIKTIKSEYGFTRLHCIKVGGGGELTVSSMKLYKGSAPTAINNVAAETAADGQRFNVAGQKVGNNAKGLYIMNGKKYIK